MTNPEPHEPYELTSRLTARLREAARALDHGTARMPSGGRGRGRGRGHPARAGGACVGATRDSPQPQLSAFPGSGRASRPLAAQIAADRLRPMGAACSHPSTIRTTAAADAIRRAGASVPASATPSGGTCPADSTFPAPGGSVSLAISADPPSSGAWRASSAGRPPPFRRRGQALYRFSVKGPYFLHRLTWERAHTPLMIHASRAPGGALTIGLGARGRAVWAHR